MSPTRRQAAVGLLAAGAAAPAFAQSPPPPTTASPPAPAPSTAPAIPKITPPPPNEPPAQVDTANDLNDHMLAPVTINGQGPFNFLLDTGANVSCVSRGLAERLALTNLDSEPVHTMVGVRDRPIVLLDQLQVGSRRCRRVRAPSLPISVAEVDGVLGVDWLIGQRLVLDFQANKIEITHSQIDRDQSDKVVVVPARRRHGQLTIVDADLSGHPISAILDSGAEVSLCNRHVVDLVRTIEARHGPPPVPQYIRMETLAGESFTGEAVFLPFLRLGGLRIGNAEVVHSDAHVFEIWDLTEKPALVLGMDLLRQFTEIALDFGRSKVRFAFI